MNRLPIRLLGLLFVCVLFATGCNVYEGFYEEGTSDNPEVLYDDGRLALQQQRPTDAILHLRKALARAQEGSVLRNRIEIKLATALLLEQKIDALSFSRMARTLTGDASSVIASKTQSQTCNFPSDHGRAAFDPRAGVNFERIGSEAGAAALAEAQTLIAHVFNGDGPPANQNFPCEEAALSQAIADLQNGGMSNEEIAEALVNYAIAQTTEAYLDIVNAGGGEAEFFYATPPAGTDYIGTCFSSEQACQQTLASTSGNLSRFDCATRILQHRAALLGSSNAEELANLARDGYESLAVGVQSATCLTY